MSFIGAISRLDARSAWQIELANSFKTAETLLRYLDIPLHTLSPAEQKKLNHFSCLVPRSFANRMQKGHATDPLLIQVLPIKAELTSPKHYTQDPLQEFALLNEDGLIQKYQRRALLITSSACAVHCRYCFRKHFLASQLNDRKWESILAKIKKDSTLEELILSGGDPLMLKEDALEKISQSLESTSIQRIRIHTRLPVVIPSRINQAFLQWLDMSKQKIVMVLHINHPNEIDGSLKIALAKINRNQHIIFNQAVVLKSVNDTVETQTQLAYRLFDAGVIPYYLHYLDSVKGASHFHISQKKVRKLYHQMASLLPGYLLPRLVMEKAGKPYKTPLSPEAH